MRACECVRVNMNSRTDSLNKCVLMSVSMNIVPHYFSSQASNYCLDRFRFWTEFICQVSVLFIR